MSFGEISMTGQDLAGRLTHTVEELLSLTMDDDTGSELEQLLGANGDARWLDNGAYGIVENCKRVLDGLLAFERGDKQPTEWQQRYLIPSWERALDIYWHKLSVIDEYYSSKPE